MANEIRLQSMLGNIEKSGRPDLNMSGYTCLARVIKIHHKKNTADVRLVRSNDVIMSIPENEGKFSCRIGTSHAHFDPKTNKASGVIEPLCEGQLVIVGYLENMKNEPWIVSSLPWTMEWDQNILPARYPIPSSETREYAKFLRVFPSQDYFRVDGEGNIEFALHGKSFIKIDDRLNDTHDGTDFEDLLEKDKHTSKTRTMEDSSFHKPKNILFVHRDNWNDESTKWTKVFMSEAGLFRISRDTNENKLTFMELHDNGSFRVKRQTDSDIFDKGEDNVEVKLEESANVILTHNKILDNGGKNTTVADISETGGFQLSKDLVKSGSRVTTSICITEDNQVSVKRLNTNASGNRSTSISIGSSNNISASITAQNQTMVNIECSANGTVIIYGKHGVTIASDSNSFSV